MSPLQETAADLTRDREKALAMFDVSRETIARLDRFVELLLRWQSKTNLVSRSTIRSLWTRHVGDSLQLLRFAEPAAPVGLPGNREGRDTAKGGVWLDLGSGGGFPGVVIACALADVAGTRVHLVESNMKKASFLREAVRQTGTPAIVHATRIETLRLDGPVDYVTARALAPLPELLGLVAPFLKRGAKALLLKGQDLDRELTEATKNWNIAAESVSSRTSETGRILVVRALSKRIPAVPCRAGGGKRRPPRSQGGQ